MEIENKLNVLGFELPIIGKPAGRYLSSVQVGNILFVGGNIGRLNGEPLKYKGISARTKRSSIPQRILRSRHR